MADIINQFNIHRPRWWVDLLNGTYAQKVVAVNADGTPISGGGGGSSATPVGPLTDRSLNLTTGGVAQQAIAANATRKYLIIRNPLSAIEELWVSLIGTAAATSPSIRLNAGDVLVFESGFIPNNAVSVFAATAGHTITIWEG